MLFAPLLLQGSEWLVVVVIVVVLIFGAGKIPDLAKSLGRAQGEFQKAKVESDLELQKLKQGLTPPQGSAPPQLSDHDKLLKAANELGVSTDGKSDEQIRQDVKQALS
jgi:sec-independent protein translocase protein TatA